MVQQFRAHAVLTENLILILRSKLGSSQAPVTLASEDRIHVASMFSNTQVHNPYTHN